MMQIEWSAQAKRELSNIAEYLSDTFGRSSVEKLIESTSRCMKTLSQHPLLGHPEPLLSEKKIEYRSLIFTNHNKIIYYVKEETVRIADIWDMRRNPEILKNRIRTK